MIEKLKSNDFPVERLQSMTRSVDARRDLLDDFKRITGTNGDAEKVMDELALFSAESKRGEHFLESVRTPEKKSLLKRGWNGITSFMKKHPFITAAVLLALVAAGVAAGFYYAGELELLKTMLGFNKIAGVAEAVGELAPVTPVTPAIPGGGFYSVPPPLPPSGGYPFVIH